ncbi:MAG: glycosyltransferase [Puniceicoccaceae bacterium]|nr:MAG: glycosyltransferase [Puniceicoccaceae bacterium]
MKQILFISRNLACPNYHGGCVYPYRLLEALAAAGMLIHYLWLPQSLPNRPFRLPFRPAFAERVSVIGATAVGSFFIKNSFRSGNTTASIRSILRHGPPAEVILDYLWDAKLLHDLPARTWVLTHELIHQRAESYLQAGATPDFTVLNEAQEIELLSNADGLIAIQDEDGAWMQTHFPQKEVVVLPLPCKRKTLPTAAVSPLSVLFIGGKTAHNRYGLEWLANEVWPQVIAEIPDARLRIYGTVSTDGLPLLESIEVRGPVLDVADAYSQNHVAAVPLRFGSGLKIKLLEAMAYGLPAVATPVGAQGFAELRQGSICPVCEHAREFAGALVRLLTDVAFRTNIVTRQDEWLERATAPAQLAERFCCAIAD